MKPLHPTPLHLVTPTLLSPFLTARTGRPVYLKMECYQIAGSFKLRGLGRLIQTYAQEGYTHIVAPSGGNAGYAAAYAARRMGLQCTVFAPDSLRQIFVDHLESEGARVERAGPTIDTAREAAASYAHHHKAGLVPPYNHPLIWDGHATLIDECVHQMPKPGAIMAAVGGGGLALGILQGIHRNGWEDVPLICVETKGTASFAATLAAGKLVTLDRTDGVATSLACAQVAPDLYEWTKRHPLSSVVVSDGAAIRACHYFAREHRSVVEPSCGAALAPLYENHPCLHPLDSVLVIVCGGIGTDIIHPL